MPTKNTTISIVVPVYKSTESLLKLVKQIYKLEDTIDKDFEILLVNDSPNYKPTKDCLLEINKKFPRVKIITLRKNQGQHIAILIGIKHTSGEFIITMDDDLQHPVNEIPKLISAIESNPDVEAVMAVPKYKDKKHSLWRNIASYFVNKIDIYFLQKPKDLIKSSYRIMTADIGNFITNNYNAMPSVSSLLTRSTDNIINIEVNHDKREFGKSNYSLNKMITLTLNNIIHYSSLPLKLIGVIGFIGFLFSLCFALIVIINKLLGMNSPGYASTVVLISFFGGVNLLAIGIVGEYLIRIIKEQQKYDLKSLVKSNDR